ncbi:SDR family oxidoreductase [Herbaspirillum sp. CAH-3]|uniref:SDR family NAD(P)-dependent oxidoreductase n=1 Tax=Herbaspirillum sp. CAH-3 TaxID=2605746 RepID=UPI0012ACAAF7|nr:SDR family oxidoreductase [Herbaspirillum sp. CAH-3]MRT31457.1 SDR family oxidoreductase [Herbaspirillum sp. CAH-3]
MNQPQTQVQSQIHRGTALVTGASSGIGAIYADRLARLGYDLILVARNRERLNTLAARITNETARNVEVLEADLGQAASLAQVEEKLRSDASITLLVNNAGIGTHTPLLQSKVEHMTDMIALNVTAPTRLTYAAVPGFVARGRGAVINISSIVAVAPEVLNGVYGGSKAFVLAFSQSLHHELGAQGVQVQAVLPGATATDFWAIGGLPLEHLDPAIVMSAEQMVDAALVGFERGELVTIPSLHDEAAWTRFEGARQQMATQLSANTPAPRYVRTELH